MMAIALSRSSRLAAPDTLKSFAGWPPPIATCRFASLNSAWFIATSDRVRSTDCFACASSARTMDTSFARRTRSTTKSIVSAALCALFMRSSGFADLDVSFSGRPNQSEGVDSLWERAEKVLEAAALKSGLDFHPQPGQGAFYGPKLDFSLKDRLGRLWQCGTIQLDYVLPERFDIHYVGSGGDRRKPVVLHRALFGSLERFIGILLEHYRGALPAWLAPEQVLLAPVGSADGYAESVLQRLSAANLRARIDCQPDSLARKVVEAYEQGIPFVVVVGPRERAAGSVRIRERSGRQRESPLNAAIAELVVVCFESVTPTTAARRVRVTADARSNRSGP